MHDQSPNVEAVNKIIKNLDSENIEQIDFDNLRNLLEKLIAIETDNISLENRLGLFEEDYRKRILGMVKAVSACSGTRELSDLAVRLVDDSTRIDAGELIDLYRTTTAKFRDHFPNSFGYLMPGSNSGLRWQDHKI